MDPYHLDYLAVSGESWLHRLPAGLKLLLLLIVVAALLITRTLPVSSAVLGCVFLLAASAGLPLRTVVALTGYPLIFLAILLLSAENLTTQAVLALAMRVLAITASVVLVILTTSYPAIFSALGAVLPGELIAVLFFTYRSLFVLANSLENVRIALHLRGGMTWRHPQASLRSIGIALAHVLVHAIELSQRMAENLTVRGFNNRIYYLGKKA